MGIRVHSGWAVLIAVASDEGALEIVERTRIGVVDPTLAGASQPYHFVQTLSREEAERYLAILARASEQLAFAACRTVREDLQRRNYHVTGCAILLSSGRPLPSLQETLLSHALIHTAEGEFFRGVFRKACNQLRIPVTGFRERELKDHVDAEFGKSADVVRRRIAAAGRSLGPPWTSDQKTAAMAAAIRLSQTDMLGSRGIIHR